MRREIRLDCGAGQACSVLSLLTDTEATRAAIPGAIKTLFAWSMR